MTDQSFETMRQAMVASQLRTTAVNDPRVIAAMASVPRERFVPAARAALAYVDRPVPLGQGRALNPPMTTGLLINEADVRTADRVLLVGAASGYAAALLARLAGSVIALEEEPALVAQARAALADQPGVTLVEGRLADGWAAAGPYDLIVVDGAVEEVPSALVDQLVDGGRLAVAIWEVGVIRLAIGRRVSGGFGVRAFADAEAVRLPGFAAPAGFRF